MGFYTTVSGRKGVIWHNGAPEDDTAIYTAPPAPAVNAAPDFEVWFNSPEAGLRVVNYHIQHELQLKAWNACRAAMLNHVGETNEKADAKCECSSIDYCENCLRGMMAQPVSSGYTFNSPVIPDGWIACTEQTPDADGAYWCWFGKEEPSVIQQRVCIWINRNNEWCDSAVTHWMPLPAAPETSHDNS
ncbi:MULTISPECIES: DUF551 domain-containing protein [Serratia]|uniref:DUF551 domain-containing protein n=1 Tax=Serratia TaxID=613 RepID=UPI00275C64A4|nr:DUF551 domain-containing protein [Serratia marcescens]MDP8624884.1 DUF551 domain-containing protein [Serratia marcescens]MDP8674315.1 DUF551 domain-containing protein [Serratia marcescens]MDP8689317.1 DUF551 domain-containing protein [Serratia marcescens]MDP8699064.1 DUF551 domain-containing protein [Serratia marcescens]MDP8708742.1 DUF551 domain-containing protein [Serratia marcescens]